MVNNSGANEDDVTVIVMSMIVVIKGGYMVMKGGNVQCLEIPGKHSVHHKLKKLETRITKNSFFST